MSIHTLDISKIPGGEREFKAIFGNNVMFAFAFAPKAAYAAIGPGGEAIAAIKSAMAAKPVEAPALDLAYNADKIVKVIGLVDPRGGEMAAKMLGKQDKLTSVLKWTATGGKELKVKLSINVKLISTWGIGIRGMAGPVEPLPELKK